jgi:hypothetical protein
MEDLTLLERVQGRLAPERYPLVPGFADAVHLTRLPDVVLKLRKRPDDVGPLLRKPRFWVKFHKTNYFSLK